MRKIISIQPYTFLIVGTSLMAHTENVTMRTFLQNKLWRDKLVEMREQEGSRINWRFLSDAEFDEQLRIKLAEETEEVATAKSRDELISELADVFEVIDSLMQLHRISREEVISSQAKKRDTRGGFAGRRYVETAEHVTGSSAEKYCLADPKKYPEIISQ